MYLSKAKIHFNQRPVYVEQGSWINLFSSGAEWMVERLNEISSENQYIFNRDVHFTTYGLGKYLLCLLAFFISFLLFSKTHIALTPLSILVFYVFEVALLFLFPLLIDGVKHPIITSIKMTWEIGFFKAVLIVIPIAIFMLIGLFDIKKRYHNWHIGCLAILFWYLDERKND